MTIFDGKRLPASLLDLDVEGLRRGLYTDKYFQNIAMMLAGVGQGGGYQGQNPRPLPAGISLQGLNVAEMPVEMQIFTRRPGDTLVAGVDVALAMLQQATGFFDETGTWVSTADRLAVEAVGDGATVHYGGDPLEVQPVLRLRGRYRDFAILETPILGVLGRASRIATNVLHTLQAAAGKPVLYFPARFDLPQTQAIDGYAYWLAVQRYQHDSGRSPAPFVSTDAQGAWWGGKGGGTVAHAALACFFGDTAATMLAFAAHCPPEAPRVALVDFNNDSVGDSLKGLQAMFSRYAALMDAGNEAEARRYRLFGVRLDTSSNVRDRCLPPLGDPRLDFGVNPRLVVAVRQALDNAWTAWELPAAWQEMARDYCRQVRIVVTGGFDVAKISLFEKLGLPVDIYGVGSSLLRNDAAHNTDFTADVVRVQVGGQWHDMAKVGRAPGRNPDLQPVALQAPPPF